MDHSRRSALAHAPHLHRGGSGVGGTGRTSGGNVAETEFPPFDPERFARRGIGGHGARLGLAYHAHGPDWVELALPYDPAQIGDPASGVIASGPILAMMDLATSMAIWTRLGSFRMQATLDLRIDYLRPATPGRTVIGRGECYRITRAIAFIRGQAHDGDPADPLAHVAGTYMFLGNPA